MWPRWPEKLINLTVYSVFLLKVMTNAPLICEDVAI